MATRQIACYIAVCDLCGTSDTGAEYAPHGPTEQAVIDIVTEKWGDPSLGWTLAIDGRLVCDTVDDEAHRTVHEEAGKTVSDCAMTVVFTSEPDEPETECERGDCLGIHRSTDGHQDCDGRSI